MNAGIRLTSGSAASARTRARADATAARVALALDLVEPAALFLFDLGADAQDRRRRLVVAFEESVDADHHVRDPTFSLRSSS